MSIKKTKQLPKLQQEILALLHAREGRSGTSTDVDHELGREKSWSHNDLLYCERMRLISDALRSLVNKKIITRARRLTTPDDRCLFLYTAPSAKPQPVARMQGNRDHAEIESLRCEVARLREQCERHKLSEARNENEILDAHKKIDQLERMKGFTRVDCTRGYNVFAVMDGHFIDEVYTLDEAVTEAKRLAELHGMDYVVSETAAYAIFSKTVTVEVIGK